MIKITNRARLPYQLIGKYIDNILSQNNTIYVGEDTDYKFDYKEKKYIMTISYEEFYTTIIVDENKRGKSTKDK